jgi:DNA-binding PadR family transcriptional regulator
VLGLVAFGEVSGYGLARLAASSVAHIWTPSQSRIYKTLPRLASRGLTQAREIEQRGRPHKAVYRITRKGRSPLRGWLDDVEDEPTSGRVVFPLKLFFCDFASPDTAQGHLAAYRRYLQRRLEPYEHLRDSARPFESDLPGPRAATWHRPRERDACVARPDSRCARGGGSESRCSVKQPRRTASRCEARLVAVCRDSLPPRFPAAPPRLDHHRDVPTVTARLVLTLSAP